MRSTSSVWRISRRRAGPLAGTADAATGSAWLFASGDTGALMAIVYRQKWELIPFRHGSSIHQIESVLPQQLAVSRRSPAFAGPAHALGARQLTPRSPLPVPAAVRR